MVKAEFRQVPGAELGVLSWSFPEPVAVLSSAAVGGGLTETQSVLNIRVPLRYARTDLATHADEVTAALGLAGSAVVLFTATELERRARGEHDGVIVDATSGITKPTWAADPEGGWTPWEPGTINLVAQLPVAVTPAAAVNAVITMTEAKTQALHELGVPGTGTASDAVVLTWPRAGVAPEPFAGPRAPLGAALALATHEAVFRSAGENQR